MLIKGLRLGQVAARDVWGVSGVWGQGGRVWGHGLNELSSWTLLFAFDKQRLLAANVINGGLGVVGCLGGLPGWPPLRNP